MNAGRIDQLVPPGKKDIHGDFGNYCYKGFRHSLCHGWASGPTAWLSRHVLGIRILEPGCKAIKVEPHLADLAWVEGPSRPLSASLRCATKSSPMARSARRSKPRTASAWFAERSIHDDGPVRDPAALLVAGKANQEPAVAAR